MNHLPLGNTAKSFLKRDRKIESTKGRSLLPSKCGLKKLYVHQTTAFSGVLLLSRP